jgi:hypothetical protein
MSVHDFGMPLSYCEEYLRPLKDIREENDILVAEWLAKGHHIQQVPRGESGVNGDQELPAAQLLRMPYWQRMAYYKKRSKLTDNPLDSIVLDDEHVKRVELDKLEQVSAEVGLNFTLDPLQE